MDIKQLRAFRTFRQQRTVRTSRRKGFSGSGHQGDEDKRDIKQQRILWNQAGTSVAETSVAVASTTATEVWFLMGLRQEDVRVIDEPAEVCLEPKQALTELVVSHLVESPSTLEFSARKIFQDFYAFCSAEKAARYPNHKKFTVDWIMDYQ